MKVQRISIVSLALAALLSMQTANIQADTTLQWGDSGKSVQNGRDLRWKSPKVKKSDVVSATYQAADDETAAIQQVQHTQPIAPPASTPMTPAQRDLVYPELRPQSITPPSGATLVPTVPTNPPSAFSSPSSEPAAPKKEVEKSSSTDTKSKSSESQIRTPAATQRPDTPVQKGTTPAPQPLSSTPTIHAGKEIECPDSSGMKSIREISYDIRPMPGTLPKECPLVANAYTGRHFGQTCFQWKAAALCTKGAYFEDVQLERYGHSICPVMEPVISGARFFLTVPMLPYKMGLKPPNECDYTLGHYRVGSCSPYMLDPFPISVRAILFEGAAIGGAVALIP